MDKIDLSSIDLQKMFEQSQGLFLEYGIKVVAALAIFIIGRIVAKAVAKGILKALQLRQIDNAVSSFIHNLSYGALYVFVIIAALSQLGIQTTSFIAILGAAGLAVGLALKGSLSNFASGVLMIIFRPFKLGDYVEAGGKAGTVEDIQIFATQLKTPDNKVVIIPNSAIMDDSIVNYSRKPTRRVDLKIGVSYDAYLPDVKALLTKTVEANDKVLHNEGYTIAVHELADSSVNFVIRVWSKTPDYWNVYFELTESIKLALDENNIGIPYPQMDVHMQK